MKNLLFLISVSISIILLPTAILTQGRYIIKEKIVALEDGFLPVKLPKGDKKSVVYKDQGDDKEVQKLVEKSQGSNLTVKDCVNIFFVLVLSFCLRIKRKE